MVAKSPTLGRHFARALVGAALAVSLFLAEAGGRGQAGTFQSEGVEFSVTYYGCVGIPRTFAVGTFPAPGGEPWQRKPTYFSM